MTFMSQAVYKKRHQPATLDELPALAVSQGMEFINKHYCQAMRWQGTVRKHKPFDAHCANRPYLLLYHNNLLKCGGNQVLSSLAVPKLPGSVKRSSMDKKTESHAEAVPSTVKKKKCSSAVLEAFLVASTSG
jgi:hypothetical protein